MAYVVTDGTRSDIWVYIPLTACTTAAFKKREILDVVESIPFGVRHLTLEIEVCFGVDDYPGESDEWMDAMVPLRRVVERRRDLAYLRLTKRGWRNHLIFEAFLWSAQGNQHINSIELDRLLLSSSAVADWMCKSTQVNQFKFNYVGYSAPHGEIVCVDTLKHDEAWCWKTTIRNILSWSFLLVLLLCAPLDVGTLLVRGSQY